MRISDWSDVCSSDLWPFLWTLPAAALLAALLGMALGAVVFWVKSVRGELFALLTLAITFVVGTIVLNTRIEDRKRVVVGKSVSVRVDLGGRWNINKSN